MTGAPAAAGGDGVDSGTMSGFPEEELLHATAVHLDTPDGPVGVLLRGPSGSGKSDLALRLIDDGARLVADDQARLSREGGAAEARGRSEGYVVARAPAALEGTLEVRGVGLAGVPTVPETRIALVVDLLADPAAGPPPERLPPERLPPERLPAEHAVVLLGVPVPAISLDARGPSAAAKVRLAARSRAAALAAPGTRQSTGQGAGKVQGQGQGGSRRDAHALPVVVVTGLSGAGRTTALKVLEDIGYEAIDNLPLKLLGPAVLAGHLDRPVALGADIRNRDFAAQPFLEQLDLLMAEPALDVKLLFMDCADEVLQRRFTETRRRHPLAQERPLADGIAAERTMTQPLKARADLVVDTSQLAVPDFRRIMTGQFGLGSGGLGVFVTSFSFRQGLPREADLVLDVRFLRNPHYVPELQPLTGRDRRVADYVANDPDFAGFFADLTRMLAPLLPRFEAEGKSYLTIAIGCTGGKHRSVAVAEKLGAWLAGQGRSVTVGHRDASTP
jgi:RNase adaptor protein for sRNA GlmZ degradation